MLFFILFYTCFFGGGARENDLFDALSLIDAGIPSGCDGGGGVLRRRVCFISDF